MAACPNCGHNVPMPWWMYMAGWSKVPCPSCNAKLETKRLRSSALVLFLPPLLLLMILKHNSILEVAVMSFFTITIGALVWESFHPRLQLRTKLPKPEVSLKL